MTKERGRACGSGANGLHEMCAAFSSLSEGRRLCGSVSRRKGFTQQCVFGFDYVWKLEIKVQITINIQSVSITLRHDTQECNRLLAESFKFCPSARRKRYLRQTEISLANYQMLISYHRLQVTTAQFNFSLISKSVTFNLSSLLIPFSQRCSAGNEMPVWQLQLSAC